LICIVGMVAGFLVSRVLLSASTFILGCTALYNVDPRRWFKDKWWLLGVVWVSFYAISSLWSDNTGFWNIHFNVKLPILLLPLAFTFLPSFSDRQLRIYTVCTGILLLLGAGYSAMFLVNHMDFYMEQYRTSKVLPTPAEDDHIRFSISIACYIIWGVYIWPRLNTRSIKIIIACILVLLTVYLHVLAAKSGIISLYIFIIALGFYFLMIKKVKTALAGIIIVIVLFFTALKTIPTFSQRIGYISYTYIVFERGDRSGKYGDIGRLISYKIALKKIIEHPWTGVGTGDMMNVMREGYKKWYPQIKEEDQLLPHNQLMDVALGCGMPVAAIFSIWLFYPLVWIRKNRDGFFMFVIWLVFLVNLMIEPFLEVQFGVFVYLFFMLWQRATLKKPERAAIIA